MLDIQEFYELTLMDESKSIHVKTSEALQMASRWEVAGPPGHNKYIEPGQDISLPDKQRDEMLRQLANIANEAVNSVPRSSAPLTGTYVFILLIASIIHFFDTTKLQ